MKPLKIVTAIVSALIISPIWLYVLYQILVRVEASELMWFLFWVYVPASVLILMLKLFIDDYGKP